MKKLLSFVLVLIAVVSLSACKKGVTAKFAEDLVWDEEKQEYVNEENATLMLWTDKEAYGDKIVELWNAKYPDVTLTYDKVGSNDTAEKLKLDGPAGLGADVFYMPHNSVVDARESGLLFEFHDRDQKYITDRMQESAYTVTMYEGKMYAAPSSVENIALAYNKQLLAALPALPTVLTTDATNLLEQIEAGEIYLEELLAGVASWENSYSGAGSTIPNATDRFYAAEGDEVAGSEDRHTIMAWQVYDAYHNYPFLTKDGYRVFGPTNNDPSKFDITSSAVKSAIESFIGTWYGNKDESALFPGLAKLEDMGWDQGPSRFQKGQVAITITGPWVMGDIKANWDTWVEEGKFGLTEDSKISDVYGAIELPKFNNDVNPTTFSGVQVTGMNVYTDYPNAAMNLMRFLASDEIMKEVYNTLGKIPAVQDSSKIPGLSEDAISQGFLKQAAYSHAMPVIQEGNYMWDPLRDVWTNIFDEKMSIEDAQAKSLDDYNKKLEDAGL